MEERLGKILNWLKLHFFMERVRSEIMKLFREIWKRKNPKEWDDSETRITDLLHVVLHPKKNRPPERPLPNTFVIKKVQKNQESKKKDIRYWDVTTLCQVLRALPKDWISKGERDQMEAVTGVRNAVSHHVISKVIPQKEFCQMWDTLIGLLKFRNVPTERINEIVKEIEDLTSDLPSLISPRVLNDEANTLLKEAYEELNDANYKQVIAKYDDALKVASLKEVERGVLFYYRSAAFLQMAKEERYYEWKVFYKRARDDAKKAAHLLPMCDKAHFRLGNAYKLLGKYEKAITAYDDALSLDPSSEDVRKQRKECRQEIFQRRRQDHMDHLEIHPLSIELEIEQTVRNVFEVSSKVLSEKPQLGLNSVPGSADVVKDTLSWDDIYPMACKMGAKYFSGATDEGNARCIYFRARLTKKGLGAEKDYKKARELFNQAAEMPPILPNGLVNEGVLPAKHCFAMMCDEGLGGKMDSVKAFESYKRAADLGFGPSANNLAVMYILRKGVLEQDSVKAVQYWKLAAQGKSTRAMHSLAGYYLKTGDARLARSLFQFAVEGGGIPARSRKQEFEAACKALEDNISKTIANLEKWEKEKDLPSSEVSVKDRMDRFFRNVDMHIFMKKYNNFRRQISVSPTRYTNVYECDYNVIAEYASKDRVYAKQVLKALQHFLSASRSLDNYKESSDAGEVDSVIKEAARCFATAKYVSYFGDEDRNLLMNLVEQKLADLRGQTCDMERYARQCYAFLRLPSYEENVTFLEENVKFLKECIGIYKKDPYFYNVLPYTHGCLEQYDEGKKVAQDGLDLCPEDNEIIRNFCYDYEIMYGNAYSAIDGSQDKEQQASELFPKNFELMYNKAYLTFLAFDGDQGMQNVIECYNTFIKHAPSDHRKVPEAYYSMALLTLTKRSQKYQAQIDAAVRMYYEKGLESEKQLLPCFLPYEDLSKTKGAVCAYVETMEENLGKKSANKEKESGERKKNKRTDPVRVQAILDHRKLICAACRSEFGSAFATTITPPNAQCAPPTLVGLKAVTLSEMSPMTSMVYKGHVIDVVIIDEPGPPVSSVSVVLEDTRGIDEPGPPVSSVSVVLQDTRGDVMRGFFYNVERDNNKIKYGAKVSIQHPYMQIIEGNEKPVIRIYDPETLVFDENHPSDSQCRSCSETIAAKGQLSYCTGFQKAVYCDGYCQTHDLEILKHICNQNQGNPRGNR